MHPGTHGEWIGPEKFASRGAPVATWFKFLPNSSRKKKKEFRPPFSLESTPTNYATGFFVIIFISISRALLDNILYRKFGTSRVNKNSGKVHKLTLSFHINIDSTFSRCRYLIKNSDEICTNHRHIVYYISRADVRSYLRNPKQFESEQFVFYRFVTSVKRSNKHKPFYLKDFNDIYVIAIGHPKWFIRVSRTYIFENWVFTK